MAKLKRFLRVTILATGLETIFFKFLIKNVKDFFPCPKCPHEFKPEKEISSQPSNDYHVIVSD